MGEEKLKPCPFCGSKSATVEKRNSGYQVRCCYCGARGKYIVYGSIINKKQAIDAWNRRAGENE